MSAESRSTTLDLIAEHASGLVVLLGPDSDVGRALARRRPDVGRGVLAHWRDVLGDAGLEAQDLVVEIVDHRGPQDAVRAAQLLGFARDAGVSVVLTNAVRGADRSDGPTLDVLDAARRLVALGPPPRRPRQRGGLSQKRQGDGEVAEEVVTRAGLPSRAARDLLASTRRLADRCALDPRADLGIGEVHFPELLVEAGEPCRGSARSAARRASAAAAWR